MKHLSIDERAALAEAPGEPSHPHLAACAECRGQVAAARAVLAEAKSVEVPEPSPLFWEHFSARVSAGVREQPAARRDWRWAWRVVVPIAVATSALLIAVSVHRGRPSAPAGAPSPAVASSGPAEPELRAEDEAWTVLESLAGDVDVDTLSDSLGHSTPGSAESAVWGLSEAERLELGKLLDAELRPGRSEGE